MPAKRLRKNNAEQLGYSLVVELSADERFAKRWLGREWPDEYRPVDTSAEAALEWLDFTLRRVGAMEEMLRDAGRDGREMRANAGTDWVRCTWSLAHVLADGGMVGLPFPERIPSTLDGAEDGLVRLREAIRAMNRAAAGKSWQIVRDELDDIRLGGEHWTSYDKMARRLASTKRTVHLAVQNGTVELQDWARSQKGKQSSRKLVGQGVAEIVLKNAADTRGGNPAEDLEQEDIDRALTRLIDEAQPAERARIQQMDRAGKLKLAQLFYEPQMDE